ncbi:rhomboid-like protein [Perkinsela sp. CCAP 1560/4]|nr:rhomboid-like protein [Perkinsela sp. CCAP 1560/4]KNH06795.1 rhomboid-like protein [Perkinsela sp. CCAP 1560/4]KNH09046.1 rhomboid-like protein [Perkinsela sp. CCAP 1560/4]|eukprot:KNH06794.1 rhomboid-like protein [Perkinsela sp. CCAP 1560/4]
MLRAHPSYFPSRITSLHLLPRCKLPSLGAQRSILSHSGITLFTSNHRPFGNFFGRDTPKVQPEVSKIKKGLAHQHSIREREEMDEEKEEQNAKESAWFSLPFGAPFHTVNIVMILILSNLLAYLAMWYCGDEWKDFFVEHFTLSHANAHRIYPFLTCSFYQEHLLQLAIDIWLLAQFGKTMLGFLGGVRMAVFWGMTSIGGGLIHVGRQWVELNVYGMDPVDVRGRCYGPNPFILGLVGVEGLIFRHLNFMQNPPIPFLVLTAFVMIIDVWRIFTTKPQEHGAATGGALVAYLFWRLPTRSMGLDKLTATM